MNKPYVGGLTVVVTSLGASAPPAPARDDASMMALQEQQQRYSRMLYVLTA